MGREWIHFIAPDGRSLLAITTDGVFPGEIRNTIDRLAYENAIEPKAIRLQIGGRIKKGAKR